MPVRATKTRQVGEFQIFEVDPWTHTTILVDIGTVVVPLLTYALIKTHIEGVPISSSDKYKGIMMFNIEKYIIVEEILVTQKS